jgi:hypothetical protein
LLQVLGSYQFQAAAAPSLATLRGVPLSNGRDLTTRLSDFSRLRHLHAAGGSPALRFAELPPSLRVTLRMLPWPSSQSSSSARAAVPPPCSGRRAAASWLRCRGACP